MYSLVLHLIFSGLSIKISQHTKYFSAELYDTAQGKRSLFTEDMKQFYSCIQIDEFFFAKCYQINHLEGIKIVGCSLEIEKAIKDMNQNLNEEAYNIIPGKQTVQMNKENVSQFPCKFQNKTKTSTRINLQTWMKSIEDSDLFWDHFTNSQDPIDPKNPFIDITFPMLVDRENFQDSYITIETLHGDSLYQGHIKNGHLKGKLQPERIKHPGWFTRLKITLDQYSHKFHYSGIDISQNVSIV